MSIVKALRYGQVTLPKKFREALNIKEGDLLEAEMEGGKIVLTPKALVNKDKAWEKVFKVLEEVHEKTKYIPTEEAEKDALELIQKARRREYVQTSSQDCLR
jgi:AbrB family looped-hinge helix DNA binding protein